MIAKSLLAGLLLLLGLAAGVRAEDQQMTIPEAIAKGAVSSVAGVPSGRLLAVPDLLRVTDIIVIGTVGEPRSYLTNDQLEIRTDFSLMDPEVIYRSTRVPETLGKELPVIATQLGGTAVVSGITFTQKEPALPPLAQTMRGLFLLTRVGDKYLIAGKYFGAFAIRDGTLMPLMSRDDFAQDYRGVNAAEAVESMRKVRAALMP